MSLVEAYADFDLLITRAGAEFSVTVVKSLAGEAHTSFVWPFAPGEIEGFHLHLAGSRHAEVVGEEAADGGLGEELGTRLFDAVFSGPVRNCYRTSRELARERKLIFRLELRLADPELETAPWEHLKDPELGDPLALEIPIFRTLAVPKERRRMPVPPPLRVLAVLANPLSDHPLAIEEEWRGLKAALGGLEKSGRVALERLGRPTLSALNGYLRHHECHVLHFVGHGEPGALVLEDEEGRPIRVSRDRLGTFCRHEPLRLAVLNVCEGAHAAGRDAFTGVGQKLIQKGTPAVIAMQAEISDAAAITFARHLYGSLAEELTVSVALMEARKELLAKGTEWGVPVLYLRSPDDRILERGTWPERAYRALVRFVSRHERWIALGFAMLVLVVALAIWWGRTHDPCPSPPRLSMKFAYISADSFRMGSDSGPSDERPPHPVTLSKSFCLGIYEVTQKQWTTAMHWNPSNQPGDDHPVEEVSWEDVHRFLEQLNEWDPPGRYRLPMESQWEYAASDGGRSIYGFGNDGEQLPEYGNCTGSRSGETKAVGSLRPTTRWGLYDMHGNVAEWVEDDYGTYAPGPVTGPVAPRSAEELRGRRGGSYVNNADKCRAAARDYVRRGKASFDTGFRIVRDPVRKPVLERLSSLLSRLRP